MGLIETAAETFAEVQPPQSRTVPAPLPAALPVGEFASDAVAFADLAIGTLSGASTAIDPARVATSFTSERHFRRDGRKPDVWAELSGFWPTADDWLRTHGNYPHHAARLIEALGFDGTADGLRARLAGLRAREAEDLVVAAGGVAAAVRRENEWSEHPQAQAVAAEPLVRVTERDQGSAVPLPSGPSADPQRPLAGIRVLDLTRVIAGPVATRTLAHWGAEVLRIDPPSLPEPEWQHLDSGAGKRSALLDLRADPTAFARLLETADVLVHGYRPGSLARAGLDGLIAARKGLVVASLSAWGTTGPWGVRRGFDSIVQAASGIAMIESPDGERPGALPAQALDHGAGYLLAGAVAILLSRRAASGGSWSAEVSLARVALELLRMPRGSRSGQAEFEPTLVTHETDAGALTYARPALGADDFPAPPRPWGQDAPIWADQAG